MDSVEQIVNFLNKYKLRLSTAESCTAGLIASLVADIPGSGQVLDCGFIVYSPEAKQQCLGVSAETIERFGLTSEEVAQEMALGALTRSGADIALANTGLAEADDEMDGVQCIACAIRLDQHQGIVSETVQFSGDRNEVRRAAASYALLQLPYYYERLRAV
ncbi:MULTISPECIES: CinA family protein [Pseudomonadaceae]|jgi:PncC family amidohydrolase|uniref:CinA domain protein n=2 Tax=Ectopseudomonas TaxID=3236654 RepID=A4XUL8_ECTM1|nr:MULTISPECIES: CinA family protein [Pseudomonas]ARS48975.1 ompetence-damaged protein [Pseudomonas mendocina]EJO91662.1 CinA domain-containing protein [Pseudomonas mendocina DLHK]ATH84237.1 CinA family protein [Pseudomonas mendocina]MBF8163728.1 CinA family protein [Pseudomonas mendocina]MDH0095596.1 CinA family protein [Pseudomonas sp. GD04158]